MIGFIFGSKIGGFWVIVIFVFFLFLGFVVLLGWVFFVKMLLMWNDLCCIFLGWKF